MLPAKNVQTKYLFVSFVKVVDNSLETISKTPKKVILNGAKRSEESMTIMHRESTRLQCSGCFATFSMTFTNAFYIETIF